MGEAAKKICLSSLQNQSCLVKPTPLEPLSFMAPTKLFSGAGSTFQVWEDSLSKGLGDAEGRNNPDLDLKLGISNTTHSAQVRDNHYNNRTFHQAEKNLIDGSSATPGAAVNFNTNHTYERQASKLGLNLNLATEMEDPQRLKRIMANRVSSKKYRMKKMLYMDHLENQTSALRLQISCIRQQIEETKNKQCLLLMEQRQLKLQIASLETERLVKEVEIGKNIAEVKRLRELQINQLQAKQHAMRNSEDGLHAINAQLDLNL